MLGIICGGSNSKDLLVPETPSHLDKPVESKYCRCHADSRERQSKNLQSSLL